MLRNLILRTVEVAILALAAYAFFFMPMGRRTPWGHVSAIFTTAPAKEAAQDMTAAGKALADKVIDETRALAADAGSHP
jgi:hypothetical protein